MTSREPSEAPSADRWDRVEALFDHAADLDPADRAAFLDRETAGDPALRAEVESLLASDLQAGAYFEQAAQTLAPGGYGDGDRVGPYRIVGRLGEGGMGTVWRAARADGAFDRDVALKVLRGTDARRFLAERQILARLDHPGIARLFDGGLDDRGRPYLAMELVEGEPLTGYCARRQLNVEARLRLFQAACAAVQYAHRRLVVHRDLKPSNVFVTEAGGGAPRVKLLDFGVAKLLDDDGALTLTGTAPHTPAYAAPEQVRGEEVTTATDVYALGALLYEVLTGARPHAPAHPTRAALAQAVLEADPPAPSAVALRTGAAGVRLGRRLEGDLDRIVLKALRKEPDRRYESAAALAADVGRHLGGHPIEARPDSRRYVIGKFVRRHRLGVAATGAGVVALLVGLGLAVWQGRVAAEERDRAEQAAAFMIDLLGEFDPNRSEAGAIDAGAVLDHAVRRVEGGLRGQPAVQAQLYEHIGQIYQTYARYDDAERLLYRALAVRRSLHGDGHLGVAHSLNHVAWLAFVRGDYAAADSLYAAAYGVARRLGADRSPAAASSLEGRGLVRRALGDAADGIPLVRQALAIREAALGPDHPDVEAALAALGSLLYNEGRYVEAAPLLRRVAASRRRTLGDHLHTAQSLSDYGAVLAAQGATDAALRVHREALALRRRLLGDAHPHVAQSLGHVGWMLQTQGRPAEAEGLYREALRIQRAHFGDPHPAIGNSLLTLGETLEMQGDIQRGLGLVAEAVRTFEAALGPDHAVTASAALRQATLLAAAGRGPEARAIAAGALPTLREAFGPDHDKTRAARALLAGP